MSIFLLKVLFAASSKIKLLLSCSALADALLGRQDLFERDKNMVISSGRTRVWPGLYLYLYLGEV